MKLFQIVLSATVLAVLSFAPAAAQNKPKTSDQIRAECQQENPPGRYADRSTVIHQCILRKKGQQGQK